MNLRRASFDRVVAFVRERFDLLHGDDRAPDEDVITAVSRGTELRGANLWVLVFAILIASVGLNVNSTAVIIGAMLISPLMGPIMGIGVGVGIYDFDLIKRSLTSLAVAVISSLLASSVYFLLTPLAIAQSELIARTNPSVWDVIIAVCGGFAGMIAATRKTWSNVIPGVAIATALMPPLCTAGYGIATGQWYFFLGAFYLFLINSVFIGLTAALVVRMMRFKKKSFVDASVETRVRRYVLVFVVATVIPSIYLTYRIVRQELGSRAEREFVERELDFPESKVLSHRLVMREGQRTLSIVVVGKPLADDVIQAAESRLSRYGLANTKLSVQNTGVTPEKVDLSGVKADIVAELFTQREALLRERDKEIAALKDRLEGATSRANQDSALIEELRVQLPGARKLAIVRADIHNVSGEASSRPAEPTLFVLATMSKPPAASQIKTLERWLSVRTSSDRVRIVVER